MAGEQAHQQASRCTAITHVERLLRLHESAHTYASNMPDALRIPVDIGAHGPHGLSRRGHILALQQAFYTAFPNGQRRQHQGAVRSDARRVGTEGVSTCSTRWSPSPEKTKKQK